jgi:histidinol dehydrogenase
VALGDYVAGPSHVLPTSGTARFASCLTANDFLRRSSVIAFTQAGLEQVAADVRLLAEKEGLTAHAASVDVRLNLNGRQQIQQLSKEKNVPAAV